MVNVVSFDLSGEGTVAVEINTGNTCSLNLTKSYLNIQICWIAEESKIIILRIS